MRMTMIYRVLKGGGVQREGVFLGNHEDSVWEHWGTLGKIRGITTPPKNPINDTCTILPAINSSTNSTTFSSMHS